MTKLADQLLLDFRSSGGTASETLGQTLEIFRPAIQLSDRLAFLAKYSDFLKDKRMGNAKRAGNLLITILSTPNMAPKW